MNWLLAKGFYIRRVIFDLGVLMTSLRVILMLGFILLILVLVFAILFLAIYKRKSKKSNYFAVLAMLLVVGTCSCSNDATPPVEVENLDEVRIADVAIMGIHDREFYEANPVIEGDSVAEEFQDNIAAVVYFENGTEASRRISEGILVVDEIVSIEQADLFCGAYFADGSIYLYMFNGGAGEAVDVNIEGKFFAKHRVDKDGEAVFENEISFGEISDSSASIEIPLVPEVSASFVCEIPVDAQKTKEYIASNGDVIYLSVEIDDGMKKQSSYVAELRLDEFGNLYIPERYTGKEASAFEEERLIDVDERRIKTENQSNDYYLFGNRHFLRIYEKRNYKCVLAPNKSCEMDFHFEFYSDDELLQTEGFHTRVIVHDYKVARQSEYAGDMYQCGITEFLGQEGDLNRYVTKIRSGEMPNPSIGYLDIFDLEFADLADMNFSFSSGAFGWGTEVEIFSDGTFSGHHHDSNMGDTGEGYPEGTRYTCHFQGVLSSLTKTGDFEYSMKCESITQEGIEGEEMITEDGFRYITSSPYGFDDADVIKLYLPGKQARELPEMFISWVSMPRGLNLKDNDELPFYGLYNVEGEQGFSHYYTAAQ